MRQLEAATKRNPRQPDFEGLDVVLDVAVDEMGGMVLPKFDSWISSQQQAEATILKAGRLWREEHASAARNSGNNHGNGNGNGNGGNGNGGGGDKKNANKDGGQGAATATA